MTQVGSIYGQALYELAASENQTNSFLQELRVLDAALSEQPDYIRLLSSPNLSKQERCNVLDDSFRGRIHQYLLNFLKILTEKNYAKYFHDCCERYYQLYNQDNNILSVTARTAFAMSEVQKAALTEKLVKITGKTIVLQNKIDPTCLGGVRLDYDGQRLDGTVLNRLENIRDMLKSTVL